MRNLFFLPLLLALFPPPLHAAGRAQDEWVFGPAGLKFNTASFLAQISSTTSGGLEAAFYTDDSLPGMVPSVKLFLNRYFGNFLVGLKPIYYPQTAAAPGHAEGVSLYSLTDLAHTDEGSITQIGLSLSNLRLSRNGIFNEAAAQLQLVQSFYGQFQFMLSGSGFFYDQNPGRSSRASTVLNQSDVAGLQSLPPVTDLPDWSLAFQFVRTVDRDADSHIFVGYARTPLKSGPGPVRSILAGMDFKLADPWKFSFEYNARDKEGARFLSYYSLALRYVF